MIYVIIILSLILVISIFPEIYNSIVKIIDYLKERKNGKSNDNKKAKTNKKKK